MNTNKPKMAVVLLLKCYIITWKNSGMIDGNYIVEKVIPPGNRTQDLRFTRPVP